MAWVTAAPQSPPWATNWVYPRRFISSTQARAVRTPRYWDRITVGTRVWMQVTGPHHPVIYYVTTIVSKAYEHPVQPGEPAYAR